MVARQPAWARLENSVAQEVENCADMASLRLNDAGKYHRRAGVQKLFSAGCTISKK
jgi:hypothetical protein